MLSKRVIACMDVRNGQVVKGVQFQDLRHAGDPAALARRYNVEGIDEVVVLDITATLEGRRTLADTVHAVAAEIFLPLAVGGLMIYGIGRGFFDANLMPTLRTIVDQRYSATGYGWLNFVGVMTGGVLIYVGGWLRDEKVDLARVFEASAVALFIVGLLLFSLKPRSGALP